MSFHSRQYSCWFMEGSWNKKILFPAFCLKILQSKYMPDMGLISEFFFVIYFSPCLLTFVLNKENTQVSTYLFLCFSLCTLLWTVIHRTNLVGATYFLFVLFQSTLFQIRRSVCSSAAHYSHSICPTRQQLQNQIQIPSGNVRHWGTCLFTHQV
jgi:hypothetical protein